MALCSSYSDSRRPSMSFAGLRVLDMGPRDLVDAPYINGDLEVYSSAGTVLTGFHLTGVTVVAPASPSAAAGTNASALYGSSTVDETRLFVGELMTFKCCQQDFSEYVLGGGITYVVGDYYQESGPQNVFVSGLPRVHSEIGAEQPARASQVVLSATKVYGYNKTSVQLQDFSGLFGLIGGTVSTQLAHNPEVAPGCKSNCNYLVTVSESSTQGDSGAAIVLAGLELMYDDTTNMSKWLSLDLPKDAQAATVVASSCTIAVN